MDIFVKLFSGIGTFFIEDPKIAIARFLLIVLGFILAWMGFRRKLEPLIMVPMGLGMIAVNAGVLFLAGGQTGTLILDPMVSEPNELVNLMQVNFLQPVYNFTFSNGLIACIVFFGIGAMSDISFILLRPWASIVVALFACQRSRVDCHYRRRRWADGALCLPYPRTESVRPHRHYRLSLPEPDLCRLSVPGAPAGTEKIPWHGS